MLPSVCGRLHEALRHPAPHLRDLRPNTHGRSALHVDMARYKVREQGHRVLHENWRVLEHPVDTAAGDNENRHRNYIDTDYKQIQFHSICMFSVVVSNALSVVS